MVTESRRRTSRLLVSKVTEDDAGNYTCAPAESKTDSVTVHVIKGEFIAVSEIFVRWKVQDDHSTCAKPPVDFKT